MEVIRKKIIYVLVTISVLLIFTNIIVETVTEPEPEEIKTEDTIQKIDSLFIVTLEKFGISTERIKLTSIKNKEYDSLEYVYKVKIPEDLPIASITKQLNAEFENSNSVLTSNEIKNHKKSVVKVESGDELKLQAYFEINKEITRIMPQVDFVVNYSDDISSQDFKKLSALYLPLTIALTPAGEIGDIIEEAKSYNIRYAIYISDKIEDENFILRGVTDREAIKKIVKNYKSTFVTARYFIIDINSSIYNSSSFDFLFSQFKNQGINPVKENQFIRLEMNEINEAVSMYKYHTSNRDSVTYKEIFISPQNLFGLKKEITAQKKLGVKFF